MAVADRFADAAALLRSWGVPVVEIQGWQGRRARTDIEFAPAGVINHHTGAWTTTDDLLFISGRTGLPGPLCHWTIYRDGTIVLGAAGYANHAGINNKPAVEQVLAGAVAEIKPGPDTAGYSANRRMVGVEVKCPAAYNEAQRAAAVALNAALVIAFGWSPTAPPVGAHKEITRRKPGDPGDDMAQFRADVVDMVAARTAQPPVVVPPPMKYPPTVRLGSRGGRVKRVQEALRAAGYRGDVLNRKLLVVDGEYGPQTRRAVKRFQKAKQLFVDGVVGPDTYAALGITIPGTVPTT